MILKYAPLAICLLLLPACSVISATDRPDYSARMPEHFFSADETVNTGSIYWSQSFSDAVLQKGIEALNAQNFELEAARARVEQAAASYGIERADLFPNVDVTTDFERKREKEDGGSSETSSVISFGGALNWELDIWGRLRAGKKAASLSVEQQKALVDQTALNLSTVLVESWITHHTASKLEMILQQQKTTNTQFLELTELRLEQGQGSALDVLQQRGRLAAAKREIPSVQADKIKAANAYDVLLGQIPDGQALPLERWPDIKPFTSLPTSKELMESRPDIRAAFLALLAADQDVAAAIADRLPKLSIGLNYSITGNTLSNIGDGQIVSFAAGLLAPIFDAGRRKAEVSRREAMVKEALADLEQSVLVAVQDIENGLSRERALFKERTLLNAEISIAQQTVSKAKLRYVNGQENYLSVLNALENLQNLHKREIDLQRDLLINRARILKAFGARWNLKKGDMNEIPET
ncbi:efflux transporter outer membrane subunit [Emcibacter sp.]|uniref:efflux transporter outer membrane subunit n=1 Tax=Emcibacter sp. TaxID=1979954 RepID=UPI003A8FB945